MDKLALVFLFQMVSTFSMFGIIWFMQLIHYPLLNNIRDGFAQYERADLRRSASFIGPLLILDLVLSIYLIALETTSLLIRLATFNLVLNILYWLWTFLFQLQQHQKLSIGFSKTAIHKLLVSHWVRTSIWCLKVATLMWMAFVHFC